jgi:hypothetical protein
MQLKQHLMSATIIGRKFSWHTRQAYDPERTVVAFFESASPMQNLSGRMASLMAASCPAKVSGRQLFDVLCPVGIDPPPEICARRVLPRGDERSHVWFRTQVDHVFVREWAYIDQPLLMVLNDDGTWEFIVEETRQGCCCFAEWRSALVSFGLSDAAVKTRSLPWID